MLHSAVAHGSLVLGMLCDIADFSRHVCVTGETMGRVWTGSQPLSPTASCVMSFTCPLQCL